MLYFLHGLMGVGLMLERTVRIRNKSKQKPMDLVDPRNKELRAVLQKAEFAMMAGDDVVNGEEEGLTGSASDSE